MNSPLVEVLESRIAPASAISITNVSLAEGDSGTTDFVFHVTLNQADSVNTISVHYATADGIGANAATTADSDYVAIPDTVLTFNPNETDKTITVQVNGDTKLEQNETFSVNLSNPTNATIATAQGTGTILNDDAPNLSIGNASIGEGNTGTKLLSFPVTLSAPTTTDVTVHFATADGTGANAATVADNDYAKVNDTLLTIPAGSTTGTINVTINGDTKVEGNETFLVNLTTPSSNVNLVGAQATGTILNDDYAVAANKTSFTYTDFDGDLVTVKSSKPLFTSTVINNAFTFLASPVDSTHLQLQQVDFSQIPGVAKSNLTITAKQTGGDGKVNVGYLNAAGIDLGAITIGGDLAKIDVGDAVKTTAITLLNVGSIGKQGTSTGAADLASTITGPAGILHVTGDFQDATLNVVGTGGLLDNGNIASLAIDGALRGGTTANSGLIDFTGTLTKAAIGSIVGGSGASSGRILGIFGAIAKINNITIGVNGLTGGSGPNSGQIAAPQITSATVAGDLHGGSGNGSGVIQSPTIGKVVVKQSIIGGSGLHSGEIFSSSIGTATVGLDLQGGTAGTASAQGFSGVIESNKIGSVTIGRSVIGGNFVDATHTADDSGSIYGDKIGTISIAANLQGGTGNNTANIFTQGTLKNLKIGGNLTGGNSGASVKLINSGYVQAAHLPSVFIGGNMTAGTDGGGGIDTSGAIRSTNEIGTLTIKGNVTGNAANTAVISAVGQSELAANAKIDLAIKSIVIGGLLQRGEILAGYSTDTTNSLRGEPVNGSASIGSVTIGTDMLASNIVAGVSAGANKFFGDADDAAIPIGSGLISKITSVIIKGSASGGTAANDAEHFGIVAQNVVSVKAGGAAIPLLAGASNDIATAVAGTNKSKPIGTTPGTGTADGLDFHAAEVV